MVPRKKRARYKTRAISIALANNIQLDGEDWEQIWALLDEYGATSRDAEQYLYAIVDTARDVVKFGKAKFPGARLKALKIGNPNDLKLWAFCRHETPFTECEIHRLLRPHRVSGEWFKLCSESRRLISAMRVKAQDVQ